MALKLEMLRTFVAVAHAGELAKAARALGRTPSAVSMTLKQVQDELEAQLPTDPVLCGLRAMEQVGQTIDGPAHQL